MHVTARHVGCEFVRFLADISVVGLQVSLQAGRAASHEFQKPQLNLVFGGIVFGELNPRNGLAGRTKNLYLDPSEHIVSPPGTKSFQPRVELRHELIRRRRRRV